MNGKKPKNPQRCKINKQVKLKSAVKFFNVLKRLENQPHFFEMNKENMAEQQENKDWLDKLGEFFSKIFINPNKDIAYSIRKRGENEIEIRDSIFDGYARGLIRFILFAGFLIIGFGGGNSLDKPFGSQISDFKMDYTWAFKPDELIAPNYKDYLELYKEKGTFASKKAIWNLWKIIDNVT